jgi:hypothetical protein
MSYVNPIWLEGQRQRFEHHDAHRFTKPEPIQRKSYSERVFEQRQAEERQAEFDAAQDAFEREVLELRREFATLKLEYELRCFQQKYSPDQPRDERGRWTSEENGEGTPEDGSAGEDELEAGSENAGSAAEAADFSAARRGGGIPNTLWNLTVRQFVSRYCAGQINRELPGQFSDTTISDLLELRSGGDAAARKCYKLLNEPRFRKK